jgi:trehalose 6-phosphate synthase
MVVVSNRLPVVIYQDELEEWHLKISPGGLVTALTPIIRRTGGLWIGWPGCSSEAPAERLLHEYNASLEYQLLPVTISDKEVAMYYRGFSNKTLWPLFHDLLGKFSFNLENWHIYLEVNRRFAETTVRHIQPDSFVWIHDYQLLYVARYLREAGITQDLNFFLHIPFPSLDMFRRLPRNREILQAMLQYDHIGFQTPADRRNFIQCIKWQIPEAKRLEHKRQSIIRHEGRDVLLGYYPISIDFGEFNKLAHSKEVDDAAWFLRENLPTKTIVLGLDRLDYTKGIPERVLAFERMLEKYPETIGQVSLVQVVVPSRLHVTEYQALKSTLDGLVGRINARFTRQGWVPIHYQFRELDRVQLLAHYKISDIALITPLRDGMNLVSKEFCASSIDNNGVLILSEFAGAAAQLNKGALMVNPFDIEGTADAIHEAIVMPQEERQRRMKLLRAEVKRNDVRRWVEWFLNPYKTTRPPLMEYREEPIETGS